jgi:hypothetical protein
MLAWQSVARRGLRAYGFCFLCGVFAEGTGWEKGARGRVTSRCCDSATNRSVTRPDRGPGTLQSLLRSN